MKRRRKVRKLFQMRIKICKNCGTEEKCRHNPEHKAVCFVPTCECGNFELKEETSQ